MYEDGAERERRVGGFCELERPATWWFREGEDNTGRLCVKAGMKEKEVEESATTENKRREPDDRQSPGSLCPPSYKLFKRR